MIEKKWWPGPTLQKHILTYLDLYTSDDLMDAERMRDYLLVRKDKDFAKLVRKKHSTHSKRILNMSVEDMCTLQSANVERREKERKLDASADTRPELKGCVSKPKAMFFAVEVFPLVLEDPVRQRLKVDPSYHLDGDYKICLMERPESEVEYVSPHSLIHKVAELDLNEDSEEEAIQ